MKRERGDLEMKRERKRTRTRIGFENDMMCECDGIRVE